MSSNSMQRAATVRTPEIDSDMLGPEVTTALPELLSMGVLSPGLLNGAQGSLGNSFATQLADGQGVANQGDDLDGLDLNQLPESVFSSMGQLLESGADVDDLDAMCSLPTGGEEGGAALDMLGALPGTALDALADHGAQAIDDAERGEIPAEEGPKQGKTEGPPPAPPPAAPPPAAEPSPNKGPVGSGARSAATLPYKRDMERSFGMKLDDLEVQVGGGTQEELAAMGARAAARDGVLMLPQSPSRHEVAHEVAHHAQAEQNGGPTSSSGLSKPTDGAEQEAEQVAKKAARGEPVTVSQRPSAPTSRLFGKVGEWASNAWDKTKEVAGDTWNKTKEVAGDTWSATKDFASNTWDKTKEVAGNAWDKTKEVAGNTWDAAKQKNADMQKKTTDFMNRHPGLKKAVDLTTTVTEIMNPAVALSNEFMYSHGYSDPLTGRNQTIYQSISNKVSDLVGDGIDGASNWISDKTGWDVNKVKHTATKGLDVISDFVPGVSNVKDATIALSGINPVTGEKVGPLGRIFSGICAIPGIGNVARWGKDAIKSVREGFGALKTVLKSPKAALNSIKSLFKAGRKPAVEVAEWAMKKGKGAWKGIKGFFTGGWKNIKALGSSIKGGGKAILGGVKSSARTLFNGAIDTGKSLFKGVKNSGGRMLDGLLGGGRNLLKSGKEGLSSLFGSVTRGGRTMLEGLTGGGKTMLEGLSDAWGGLKGGFKEGGATFMENLEKGHVLDGILGGGKSILKGVFGGGKSLLNGVVDSAKVFGGSVKSGGKTILEGAKDSGGKFLGDVLHAGRNAWGEVKGGGAQLLETLIESGSSGLDVIKGAGSELWDGLKNGFGGMGKGVLRYLRDSDLGQYLFGDQVVDPLDERWFPSRSQPGKSATPARAN